MAVTSYLFDNFIYQALASKNIDFNSDTIKMQLHTSTMALDGTKLGSWDFHADLTNEVANGNGYATGGATLSGCSVTLVPSTSAPNWAANTAYTVGQIVAKTTDNGHVYRCIVAGTSHSTTEPTWTTTPGDEQPADGTVTWVESGRSYIKLSFTAPSWTTSTITARYAVLVDTTPGSSATNPLIGVIDFGEDVSTVNGTLTVTPDATYGFAQIFLL